MKNMDLNCFKQKLERKQELFELPDLPDSEWSRMIEVAKAGSIKTQNKNTEASIVTIIYSIFASKKLSAVLTVVVLMTIIFTYSAVYNSPVNTVKRNNIIDTRSNLNKSGTINVSAKSFI